MQSPARRFHRTTTVLSFYLLDKPGCALPGAFIRLLNDYSDLAGKPSIIERSARLQVSLTSRLLICRVRGFATVYSAVVCEEIFPAFILEDKQMADRRLMMIVLMLRGPTHR